MEKLFKNAFLVILLVISVLFTISCKYPKKEVKETESNAFAGTWISKEFITNMITDKGIKTIDNGVTEIVVPENLTDSITFINEDLESGKYSATIKNDTLINYLYETKTQKAIIKNGNLILLPLDERYQPKEYSKADVSLVKKSKEANVSVLRILINKTLSDHTYTANNSKNEVNFTEDGKVNGLGNFKSYYISINGDSANIEDMTAINFTTFDGSLKTLGIEFKENTIDLYDVVLLTKSDEKPSYKKGKLLYSLHIAKSEK